MPTAAVVVLVVAGLICAVIVLAATMVGGMRE